MDRAAVALVVLACVACLACGGIVAGMAAAVRREREQRAAVLKTLENDLRRAKDFLEVRVRGSKVSIFDFDMPDGKLATARQTMINVWETLGYDASTAPVLFGPGSALVVHPEDLPGLKTSVDRYLMLGSGDFEREYRVIHRNGEVQWRLARGQALWAPGGAAVRFVGSFFDISEQKRVEAALRESERRWRTLAEALPQIVWTATPDGAGDYYSGQAETYTGRPAADLVGPNWLSVIHPDDHERTLRLWAQAQESEGLYDLDFRILRSDGVYRWFNSRAAPMRDDGGRIVKWCGSCTDIDDGKRVEERLRKSEERWRLLAEAVPPIVFTTGTDGSIDYFNERATAYAGVPMSELLGERWVQTLHADDVETTMARWAQAEQKQQRYEVEHRIRGADGTYRWFSTRAEIVRESETGPFRWFGTCTDIEKQKALEAELRDANERLEVAIRSSNLSIWEYDVGRRLEEGVSSGTELSTPAPPVFINVWESLGYDVVDAPPTVASVIHPEDVRRVEEETRAYLAGETASFETEHRVRSMSGEYRWVLGRGVALRDPATAGVRFIGTSVDITAIKRIERDLLATREAAERASQAKDEFLANVSHEIRTPMNAILGMTELALDSTLNEPQRQLLSSVKSAAKNLLGIINDLLDFSKIAAGKLALDEANFMLRAEVGETLRSLAPRAHRKRLELHCNVHIDVPEALFGDAGRLRQLLMNLVGNALKFTAEERW